MQSGPSVAQTSPAVLQQEVTTREANDLPLFRVKVHLVMVPVVVRDGKGHPVRDLRRDDFQLLDRGKPQEIRYFEAVTPNRKAAEQQSGPVTADAPGPSASPATHPDRFVAYVFDDIHLRAGDLAQTRAAAEQQLRAFGPSDRVALYTTSRDQAVEFTSDVAQVRERLQRVTSKPNVDDSPGACPAITYFAADKIENYESDGTGAPESADPLQNPSTSPRTQVNAPVLRPTTYMLQAQLQRCPDSPSANRLFGGDADKAAMQTDNFARTEVVNKASVVHARARFVLLQGDREAQNTLRALRDAVHRLASAPGERVLVFVSSGLHVRQQRELDALIDEAVRAKVVIHALSARGLEAFTPAGDASVATPLSSPLSLTPRQELVTSSSSLTSAYNLAIDAPLQSIAEATGGNFGHNSNDFGAFFRQAVSAPEYSYLLGFSPQNLKSDGTFHSLKLNVIGHKHLAVQARHGYFAPARAADAAEAVKQDVESAMFSQEEISDFPVALRTQYSKLNEAGAKLIVLVHVDLSKLPMTRADGRTRDDLALYAAVFDDNGQYKAGNGQIVQLRLRDDTLAQLQSGIDLKTTFNVQTGNYLLRVVVRDSEGELVSAVNKAVQIQ